MFFGFSRVGSSRVKRLFKYHGPSPIALIRSDPPQATWPVNILKNWYPYRGSVRCVCPPCVGENRVRNPCNIRRVGALGMILRVFVTFWSDYALIMFIIGREAKSYVVLRRNNVDVSTGVNFMLASIPSRRKHTPCIPQGSCKQVIASL